MMKSGFLILVDMRDLKTRRKVRRTMMGVAICYWDSSAKVFISRITFWLISSSFLSGVISDSR